MISLLSGPSPAAPLNRELTEPCASVFVLLINLDDIIVSHFHLHVIGGNRTFDRTLRFQFGRGLI